MLVRQFPPLLRPAGRSRLRDSGRAATRVDLLSGSRKSLGNDLPKELGGISYPFPPAFLQMGLVGSQNTGTVVIAMMFRKLIAPNGAADLGTTDTEVAHDVVDAVTLLIQIADGLIALMAFLAPLFPQLLLFGGAFTGSNAPPFGQLFDGSLVMLSYPFQNLTYVLEQMEAIQHGLNLGSALGNPFGVLA